MSKHFSINVVAPWKKKNIAVLAEWDETYDTFADGVGRYEWKTWKKKTIDDAADALDVCARHCTYNICPSTTNAWSMLSSIVATIGNPLKNKQRIKLDDTECLKCLIGDYRKPTSKPIYKPKKPKQRSRKRSFAAFGSDNESEDTAPKRKKNKKNKKKTQYDEEICDNDTDSDEFDEAKSRPAKINANIWMACLNSMREKHGNAITAPGLVAFAKLLNGPDGDYYDALKIPDCILQKYAKKQEPKDIYKPFSTHKNYSQTTYGYPHHQSHFHQPYGLPSHQYSYPPPPHYYGYPPPPPPQQRLHNNNNSNTNTHSNYNASPTITEIENDINDVDDELECYPPPKTDNQTANQIAPLAIQNYH